MREEQEGTGRADSQEEEREDIFAVILVFKVQDI